MEDIRILTDDEISAVSGGMTDAGGGGLPAPHPQPSPIDLLVHAILKLAGLAA